MRFVIEGGVQLKGQVKTYGAKNSVFKLMLAATLSDTPSEIGNLCLIRNTFVVKDIVESLGGSLELNTEDKIARVSGKGINRYELPSELGKESRASSMMIPVLLHRFGKAVVPMPGGDNIGVRSLDRHFAGLEALGARVTQDGDFIRAEAPHGLTGADYTFAKNTHTGTETLLLASCLAKGTTTLRNAAAEPEVDDLIGFLNTLGADIKRIDDRTIVIKGVEKLDGGNYSAMPDRNEVVTFACCALATKGDVRVIGAQKENLAAFLEKIEEIGGGVEVEENEIRFFWKNELKATNVTTAPFPGFMTDWQALWVTLMTQATGLSVVHETVYESRFGFVAHLQRMGAKIELFNPSVENPEEVYNFNLDDVHSSSFHAARITGPTSLRGENFEVLDIRAGATLCLAALIAQGQSSLENIELIERGYENLDGRLRELGAKIYKAD